MTWRAELEAQLGRLVRVEPVAGGDINDAWCAELATGRVFVKTHARPPSGMYAAEAAGLAWLAEGPIRVPAVIAVGDRFLALEWLALGPRDRATDVALGRGLAGLHRLGAPMFGHPQPSFLATIAQDNTAAPDAATLWIERRLRPMIDRLRAQPGMPDLRGALARLAAHPDRFGPPEPPARLHGDLWWGNTVVCAGAPVLIDPAAYGGPREIDLAMLALFGGLPDALVAAYAEVWPLAAGWRERIAVWQLYPLAAHAVLFGGGYVGQLARSLAALG